MTEYRIHAIKDETIGYPPTIRRNITPSISDEIPEGAVSLQDLADAEIERAQEAERRASTAFGALLTPERALKARTELHDLLGRLPDGAVAYEPITPAKQVQQV